MTSTPSSPSSAFAGTPPAGMAAMTGVPRHIQHAVYTVLKLHPDSCGQQISPLQIQRKNHVKFAAGLCHISREIWLPYHPHSLCPAPPAPPSRRPAPVSSRLYLGRFKSNIIQQDFYPEVFCGLSLEAGTQYSGDLVFHSYSARYQFSNKFDVEVRESSVKDVKNVISFTLFLDNRHKIRLV